MNELKMVFDATFIDAEQVEGYVTRINSDLAYLQKVLPFDFYAERYNVLDSELELQSGIPSVHLKVHVECKTKQDKNYHNVAMIFQGYFALFGSCPNFHSVQIQLV